MIAGVADAKMGGINSSSADGAGGCERCRRQRGARASGRKRGWNDAGISGFCSWMLGGKIQNEFSLVKSQGGDGAIFPVRLSV